MRVRSLFSMNLLAAAAASLLSACGGGGGGGDGGSPATLPPVVAKVTQSATAASVGQSYVVAGTATAQPNAMKSMNWSATALTADAPEISVTNADCAVGARSSKTINGITQSNWACDAIVKTPSRLAAPVVYRLTFQGVDDHGNAASDSREITVAAGGGAEARPVAVAVTQGVATASVGKSYVMSATAASQVNALTSMAWSVAGLTAGAPMMTLSNADCAISGRSTKTVNSVTQSNWACDAILKAPSRVNSDAVYRVTFQSVDNLGNSASDYREVTVAAGGGVDAPPTATVQPVMSANSGAEVGLNCLGSGGILTGTKYVYTWVVKSNPGGLVLSLDPDPNGNMVFKAPSVTVPTNVTMQCRVMDDVNATGTADSVVTISPANLGSAIADAGLSHVEGIGATVTLSASESSAPNNALLFYSWTQVEGPTVVLSSPAAMRTTFQAPSVTAATRLTFRLAVSTRSPANPATAAASELSTVTIYVAPLTPLTLSVNGAVVAVTGTVVNMQVGVTPNASPLYYAWTQVSGPSVTLGGANTTTASFVTPLVTTGYTDSTFSVKVSRKPIAESTPSDIVSADVIVRTTPPATP